MVPQQKYKGQDLILFHDFIVNGAKPQATSSSLWSCDCSTSRCPRQ
ncbi:MAG: hypothetical protein OJF50_003570 [Nitrospira sp.]|nr:hypothetical protein [Nitrospira sp.]